MYLLAKSQIYYLDSDWFPPCESQLLETTFGWFFMNIHSRTFDLPPRLDTTLS